MEYLSLINDFIDGDLEASAEDSLFVELAANRKLRTDLRQFIDFERAVENDIDVFQASGEVTGSLFATLNIDKPDADNSGKGGFLAFLSRYTQGVIGGIIGSIITALLFIFFFMQEPSSHGSTADYAGNLFGQKLEQAFMTGNYLTGNALIDNGGPVNNNIPIVSSSENIGNSRKSPRNTKSGYKKSVAISNAGNDDEASINFALEDKVWEQESDILGKEEILEDENIKIINQPSINISRFSKPVPPLADNGGFFAVPEGNSKDHNLSFEIRNAEYLNFNNGEENVDRSTNPILENASVGVYYNFSENFSAGYGLRQEFFYQSYEGTIDGKRYKLEQHTNYFTHNLSAKYKFYNYGKLDGYGELSLGINQTNSGFKNSGMIGRAMIGLEYNIYDDFGMVLGFEVSNLNYRQNGTNYNSPKAGFQYGVKINY